MMIKNLLNYTSKLGISFWDFNSLRKVKLSHQEDMTMKVFGNPVSHIGRQYKELIEYQQLTNARTLQGK